MHLPLPRVPRAPLLLALVLPAVLAPLRADVVVDNSPAATHGTAGSHTVSGSSSTLIVTPGTNLDSYNPATDDLLIGLNSTGSLNVTNGAAVSVTGAPIVEGENYLLGGTLLGLSSSSSGTLTVSAAGTFSTNWLQLGTHLNSTATLNVTGSGSTATVGANSLWMYSPTSSVTVANGATLNTTAGELYAFGGSITVSSGSQLSTGVIQLNTQPSPQSYLDAALTDPGIYSATLLVTGTGSTLSSANYIELSANSSADTVSLTVADHASLSASSSLTLGAHTSLNVSDAASVTLTDSLYVNPDATLTLTSGATLSTSWAHLNGSAYLSGTGTTLNATSGIAIAEVAAPASLTLSGGATVTTTSLSTYDLGDGEGGETGNGTLSLSGDGTRLTVSGTSGATLSSYSLTVTDGAALTTNRYLELDGTATVSAGGSLTSTYAGTTLSYLDGTTTVSGAGSSFSTASNTAVRSGGTLTVTDHGTFNAATNLQIGNNSAGSLLVSAGGTVNTHGAVVGYYVNATPTTVTRTSSATLTGADSSWTNTGILAVGAYRNADLTVSAGATLTNNGDVRIGSTSSSTAPLTATALVTGAGSRLIATGSLTVGYGAYNTSSLTLADHGRVTAASTTVNTGDTLTLGSYGTLDTVALTVNTGGTVLAHDDAVFTFNLGAPSLTAPLTFAAGSTFAVDSGASIYLSLSATTGFGAGTYSLFSFDPAATLTGLTPASFYVATNFGGYSYGLDLTSSALLLTVTDAPGAAAYEVAGLSAIPEPSTNAALLGLAAVGLVALHRRRRSAN